MDWIIDYDNDSKILNLIVKGRINSRDFKRITNDTVDNLVRNNAALLLIDIKQAQSDIDIVDIYNIPKYYESITLPRSIKIAFLKTLNFHASDDLEFYRTTCLNLGYEVNVFTHLATAKQWLTAKPFV